MRTVVFINPHARQAERHVAAVRKFFGQASQFEILDFIVVERLDKFATYIDRLKAHKQLDCVVVGSGDGTIVALLNALKQRRNIVYGFIPLGTSNTFVRSLGLPLHVQETLRMLSSRHVRQAYLGSINGTLFANIADIGVPAKVADSVTDRPKKYLGDWAYVLSGVRELVRHRAFWCEITIDGKTEAFYTHHVYIANGTYRGSVPYGKKELVYTDILTVGYSKTTSRLTYSKQALDFIVNKPDRSKKFFRKQIQRVVIKTKPTQVIQADGEIIGKTPAEVRIAKNAIQVFAPADASALKQKK